MFEVLHIKEGTEVTAEVFPIAEREEKIAKIKSVKNFAAYGSDPRRNASACPCLCRVCSATKRGSWAEAVPVPAGPGRQDFVKRPIEFLCHNVVRHFDQIHLDGRGPNLQRREEVEEASGRQAVNRQIDIGCRAIPAGDKRSKKPHQNCAIVATVFGPTVMNRNGV